MSSSVRKIKNGGGKIRLGKILKDKRKKARLYLLTAGLLLIILGFSFSPPSFGEPFSSPLNSEADSFSKEPITVDKALLEKPDTKKKDRFPPKKIIISSLGIDLPVKEAKVVDGYWEVFANTAGFGLGSSYPGEVGNQVIFAHGREGLFLPLRKAKVGQKVIILTEDNWYEYEIKEIKEVLPSQTEIISPTKDETLTLYTCSGFSDSKRLIVVAKRV